MRTTIALVLSAVLVAACGSGGAEMARVGDTSITEGDLAALYEGNTMPVGEDMRASLFRLVALQVLVDAMVDQFGVVLDDDAVEAEYQARVADIQARGITPAEALGILNAGFGMVRFNAKLEVMRDTVVTRLVSDPEYVDTLFATGRAVTTVCVQHVLVPEQDEAVDVLDRLVAGEDIGEVALDVSLDTAPAGDLGCRQASTYVPQFADATLEAPIGEPFGPVQTEFGWHVLVVSERTALDRAEFEANPLQHISATDASFAWADWVNDQLRLAEVDVVPRYGRWSPTGISAPAE